MVAVPPFIVSGARGAGKAPVGDPPAWTDVATQAELDAHVAAADPHVGYQKESEKAAASGYAGLDANIFVPSAQLARYRAGPIAVGPSDLSEVTLISQTIPGGLMGTTGILRCTIVGDYLNNSAANRTFTFRVYAGGTKIYDSVSPGYATAATRRAVYFPLSFANLGAANSNRMSGIAGMGVPGAPTTGFSALTSASAFGMIASDIVAIDTSIDWVWKVTWQLSNSEATSDARISSVLLEVL